MNQRDTAPEKFEFEKYSELTSQIQGYASFGTFPSWTHFLSTLNDALKAAALESKGLRWVKASERLPRDNENRIAPIAVKTKYGEYDWFYYTTLFQSGSRWKENVFQWLDESSPSDTFSREEVSDLIDDNDPSNP